MAYLVPTYYHWAVSVVDHIITNGAQDGPSQGAHATRSHDNHDRLLLIGRLADDLSWPPAEHRLDGPRYLQPDNIVNTIIHVLTRVVTLWL